MGDVPEDVLSEILKRTPLKTVLRLTRVCKSWYSLITSPSFIYTYNPASLGDIVEKKVILYSCSPNGYHIRRDNEAFDLISDLVCPQFEDPSVIRNVVVLNGVICMYVSSLKHSKHGVFLWNPVIRRLFQVPQLNRWGTIGFGSVPETNNYKIVNLELKKATVYELGTGSWKNVNSSENFLDKYSVDKYAQQCFYKDTIHWVGRNVIVTFNVKKEELGVLMMPSGISADAPYLCPASYLRPVLFQDCLAVMEGKYYEAGGYTRFEFCIWVMNEYGDFDSWTKNVIIGLWNIPLMIRHNGDLLLERCGEGCVLVSHNHKNRKFNNLVQCRQHILYADYFEPWSLALLDKPVVTRMQIYIK